MNLTPLLCTFDEKSNKHHKIWKFDNNYGISAVKQPSGDNVRGTDGETWSVAVIKFYGPYFDQFEVDYDNPLCKEQCDLFMFVPDNQLESIVIAASRMETPSFN